MWESLQPKAHPHSTSENTHQRKENRECAPSLFNTTTHTREAVRVGSMRSCRPEVEPCSPSSLHWGDFLRMLDMMEAFRSCVAFSDCECYQSFVTVRIYNRSFTTGRSPECMSASPQGRQTSFCSLDRMISSPRPSEDVIPFLCGRVICGRDPSLAMKT